MSGDDTIPPGVDAQSAALLSRAYGLASAADSAALYRDWAHSYDRTMLEGLGYVSPERLAALLAHHVPDRNARVLDIGCGTGLAGGFLAAQGFTHIDGIDISPEMLAVARRSGHYRELAVADLTGTLAIADGAYAAAICSGTFTHGHVSAACLPEILRILRPGAMFACTVHRDVWDAMGFATAFDELEHAHRIAVLQAEDGAYYLNSPAPDGRYCLIARL